MAMHYSPKNTAKRRKIPIKTYVAFGKNPEQCARNHSTLEQIIVSGDQILDEKTAAARAGISARTLRKHSENGRAPERLKISTRRVGYRESDVNSWIASLGATSGQHAA